MSAINTKIKTFILTAISAAILSACGGGGGGGNAALSTGSTNTGGSSSPEKNGGTNNNNNTTPSDTNNSNSESPAETTNNKADKLEELTDEKPISPLNTDTPLSTSFISSTSAQQGNPNIQLRRNNDTNRLFYTDNQTNNQNGLVSSLDFKANDEVKLDAIVLYNKTEEGNATQVQFTTTDSIIAKAFSGGKTKSDVSGQTGQEPNHEFKVGQSTLDQKIVELYQKSENAKSALASAERKLANDTNAFAEALKNKTQAERQAAKAYNSMLETLGTHSEETASFEKAKKELEEAKANFKAAIEKTTGESVEELENANKALNTAQDELDKQISTLTKNLNNEDLAKFKAAKNNWENAEENLQTANQNVISAKATRTSSKDARDAAEKAKNTAAKAYDDARQVRQDLTELAENHANQLAYIAKDKNGTVFDKRFDGIYIIRFANGTQIVMHDPAAAGWTYQTFAHYIDPKSGVIHGYQSLGDETKFTALPASGTATYNGLTTAYVVKNNDQNRQLTADVKAIVDFGLKGVRFETTNSQFHSLDANGRRVTVKGADYDMKGTAKWENGNLFLGKVEATAAGLKGNLSGKFFGPSAAEIGGTYGLKKEDGSEHMIGGYGAKRQ
ncbi:transferrin-binding protein-like solute binding protein [Neisseria sp. HMSC066H01]|uniref:transferrin-binding protein-like solute binding protein n=1 Tax=Neisseria sp. HMSC066H01 TaxID=1715031 RepID=UPI000A8D21D8|nr:transferrin-binding protein-like solute binding protein [Neisseria sp. HMSC066H01]